MKAVRWHGMAWHGIVREERACCHFAVVDVVGVIETNEVHVCATKRNEKLLFFRDKIAGVWHVLQQTWHEMKCNEMK